MKVAVTGATGLVGRFIVKGLRHAGTPVQPLKRPSYQLGGVPDLTGCDALVHCAFQHVPGRYRGGEGDDPAGFRAANLDGSIRLFEAAKAQGLSRVLFLSSRAVYGDYPAGTQLTEDLPPRPDTLYGQVKWEAEQALSQLNSPGFSTASLRATGVYGSGPGHKWTGLFEAFAAGHPIAPRCATEVHGDDISSAVQILLQSQETGAFNASDLLLDRHDLLTAWAKYTCCTQTPPPPSDQIISAMACDRLQALGWQPSGIEGLLSALDEMAAQYARAPRPKS